MLTKRFFYVSAALFLLALTYHLGASGAGAQGAGSSVADFSEGYAVGSDGSGLLHVARATGGPVVSIPLPRPGTPIACYAYLLGQESYVGVAKVVYGDGTVYVYDSGTGWTPGPVLFSGAPTATTGTTWGKVKADYRK